MSNNPKVSVCVMTYNQENYIGECLDSILSQECNFDFEVIVGEDCSTDNTKAIVQKYAEKYPNIIKPIFYKENVGGEENYRTVHNAAKGELIASMDGDDFWYQGKLSYQVDFFDKNPNIVQMWHCADIVNNKSVRVQAFPSKIAQLLYPDLISSRDIALSYALVGQRSTQMFRASDYDINLLPPGFLDFHIAFLISLNGKSYYSKKTFGAYRVVLNNSLTTNSNSNSKITVDLLSEDLMRIAKNYPEYKVEAKSNILVRKFMSKLKGHDIKLLNKNLKTMEGIKVNPLFFLKSCYYFILQKI